MGIANLFRWLIGLLLLLQIACRPDPNCSELTCPSLDSEYIEWANFKVGDTLLYRNEFGDPLNFLVVEIAQNSPYVCEICDEQSDCCIQFGGMRAYSEGQNLLLDVELRSVGQMPPPPRVTYTIFTLDDPFEDVVFMSHRHSWEPLQIVGANILLDTFTVGVGTFERVLFSQIDTANLAPLSIEPWQMWVHQGGGILQFRDGVTNRVWQLDEIR